MSERPAGINPLRTIGAATLGMLATIGQLTLFMLNSVSHFVRPPIYFRLIGRQMIDVGYYSLPVVGLTTLFSGMVIALQSYTGATRVTADAALENVTAVVVLSITRELAPVLAGLMVAGRIGASMAAEIGTMRVTEQIDALTTLSTNPIKYLVVPRIIAGLTMLPLLVLVGDVIGIFGGYVIGVFKLDFNPALYIQKTYNFLEYIDVVSGLVKAAVFGFVVTLLGCYMGYHSSGGAQGVGAATTNAVVASAILILILNYLISQLFFGA
ncbi:MAG: MlaE family ABC transporter permease [Alphaproteobacteria bacterium]|jgi:phospholipid/cholesterol/gamma-HCH transport system permease protein